MVIIDRIQLQQDEKTTFIPSTYQRNKGNVRQWKKKKTTRDF